MMCAYQHPYQIQLMPMIQLAEVVDKDDDWSGITDAASRRRRQNRLNVRAYRRRKALEAKTHPASLFTCGIDEGEAQMPHWVEDKQTVVLLSAAAAEAINKTSTALMTQPAGRIIFPLAPDHLITLLQFNVLRACAANRRLLSPLASVFDSECSSEALHILPSPSTPQILPQSLHPTALQRTVPHEEWIDIIPHPRWRDNLILAIGTFDEEELWSDTIGGLFEGFPASEIEQRGIIAWDPPWDVSGWELTEGFWRKWGWSFKGCADALEATNKWRRDRGEEPLVFDL